MFILFLSPLDNVKPHPLDYCLGHGLRRPEYDTTEHTVIILRTLTAIIHHLELNPRPYS